MSMACKTCGGTVIREGNYYVCEYCSNKWEIDSGNDVHAVDRANAWSALRDGDFEKASELFENIIIKEENNYEAYWGRALAFAGIVYVTDMNENKKVPTCNNITEESFANNKDVQKAISLAPVDIAEGYKQQVGYIEKVRIEWLEKASKEPAYDVFISFKDSDRENGIERTQDSVDAQDLYNALVDEGYKVFFSRISLRDKISEQYEPYIYNAIKTAKVMIVFGEKTEYFSSAWIKNEWNRFKNRIEKGEKHKNSLVVVYKNMNPGDLPVVLKSRQCLNAGDMTFLSDLNRHIKRVVDESKKEVHIEKIEIEGGQISKKATTLPVNSVVVKELGESVVAETSITEKQTISLIKTYLEGKCWEDAIKLADDVLFDNPSCAEAIWYRLLAKYNVSNKNGILVKINNFIEDDYICIEKVLNCASKSLAEQIIELLFESEMDVLDYTYKKILDIILPFSITKRKKMIRQAFENVIKREKIESFKLLLNTLEANEIDRYIDYNYRYSMNTNDMYAKICCLNDILKVDNGNIDALRELVYINLSNNIIDNKIVIESFENLLKYTTNINEEVINYLDWLCKNIKKKEQCDFAKQLIRYYTEESYMLKNNIIKLSYKIINERLFCYAEYFLELILSFEPQNADAYWGICLIKTKSISDIEIPDSPVLLSEIPEFNKYLTLVDERRREACLKMLKGQKISEYRKKCEIAYGLISVSKLLKDNYFLTLNIHTLEACYRSIHYSSLEFHANSNYRIRSIASGNCIQTVDGRWYSFNYSSKDFNYHITPVDNAPKTINREIEDGIIMSCNEYYLKNDGTVFYESYKRIEIKGLENVIQIAKVYKYFMIAILQNGTVVCFDYNGIKNYKEEDFRKPTYGEYGKEQEYRHYLKTVLDWKDMVAIKANNSIIIGIKKDGTIIYANYTSTIVTDIKCFNCFETIIEDYEASIHKSSIRSNEIQRETYQNNIEHNLQNKQGCYIATCVYGSYDCPEVWVLRRFRDRSLRSSWYGRVFIKIYYLFSPLLVDLFGKRKIFRFMLRRKLDKLVNRLKTKGYETFPYQDQ